MAATLYLVATPIGNLEDITFRAIRILRDEVSVIACEDTRQTSKLLAHFEIRKPLVSYHEHNEEERVAELIAVLERGDSVALVSDAGTPLVSDPGYRLVRATVEKGLRVVPLPGASAVLAGLAASGLPTDQFRFVGFLPSKAAARRKALEALAGEPMSVVAYESPHRILETLADMAETLGNRPMVLARELTKLHEEFLRGTAEDIWRELDSRGSVKGEITLVLGRSEEKPAIHDPVAEVMRLEQDQGLGRMDAIKTVAKQMGIGKREIYRLLSGPDAEEPDNNPKDRRRG